MSHRSYCTLFASLLALMLSTNGCRRELNMDEQYNLETLTIMERVLAPESVAIDVGAYHGDILVDMVRLAPKGRHHAFEPQPEAAKLLRERFQGKNAVIHEVALADKPGTTQFHQVASNPSYSGIKERAYEKKEEVRLITVKVDTLDRLLKGTPRVDLIKVDVEGGELGVLKGALGVIKGHRPVVVFEHGRGAAEFYGTTPDQIFDLLATRGGLQINTMKRALVGERALSRDEFREQFDQKINYYFAAYPDSASRRLAGHGTARPQQ